MKDMPLPLGFEGKGVFEICVNSLLEKWKKEEQGGGCFLGAEPTSVLDSRRSPSPPTSTSTLSSSCGGGGGGSDTAGVAAVSRNPSQKWLPAQPNTTSSNARLELQPIPASLDLAPGERCGLGMEDWESVLSETAASPGQEQSIFRWIMGDVEDPSVGMNKLLQSDGGGGAPPDFEFSGGFGVVDQGFGFEPCLGSGSSVSVPCPSFPPTSNSVNEVDHGSNGPVSTPNHQNFKIHYPQNNPNFAKSGSNLMPISFNQQQLQQQPFERLDEKPQIFIPQMLINPHQAQHTQNPAFFLPLPYAQGEQNLLLPQAKRHNSGPMGGIEQNCSVPKVPFTDSGPELFARRQHQQQLQLLPHHLQQRPAMGSKPMKMIGEEMGQPQQYQQAIIDQLFNVAELVETGNSVLAQGILARLNHQLSPIGRPFQRAAFYFKEALQSLLHSISNNTNPLVAPGGPAGSPHSSLFSLIFKIGAYKSFSEISPLIQFANFTCIQAILEASEGFDRIHIIDFDIGYGGQWASLMQELAMRNGGAPSLKITAFASPSNHDQLELDLARQNLILFASESNMAFELEILGLDSLNSLPLHVLENEAVAVNLPVGSFSNYPIGLPLVLRAMKQLYPKIMVSLDRGCERTDLPYPHHILHAFQSYLTLLESLDAVNVNLDALQKIERFLLQPDIEKIVLGRQRNMEKTPPWRNLLLSSGFSPLTFSNFSESQAECLVKRAPVRGFHIEMRQSSLVLCWQSRDLISASAWRC